MERKKISVLVPCYNEEENVIPISQAIIEQIEKLEKYDYELIFIDNCSQDTTREKLEALCGENKKIKAIFNARNFGQFNSPFYGYKQTNGDCMITLCCDFQDPPEVIPRLVEEWEKGAKIVCAVKKTSKENRLIRGLRTIYYKLIKKMSEVEQIEHFTGFGLYDKDFVQVIKDLDDSAPFIRGIVAELGFKKVEISYEQAKRRAGKTSNNFSRLYDAAMLSFTTYTKSPIRWFMFFGIFVAVLSFLSLVCFSVLLGLGYKAFELGVILSAIGLFSSVSYIGISVIGEYLLNVKTKVSKRPLVIEEKRINFDE